MSRVDAQSRITSNLAIIRYQLQDLAQTGTYMPAVTEQLVQDALNAATDGSVRNLNADQNNFPGIDLRSTDEAVGYQVTRHVTKSKFDKTKSALVAELGKPGSRVDQLREVYVIGLSCVKNSSIQYWQPVGLAPSPRIRAVDLRSALDLSAINEENLFNVDDVIQSFVHDWSRPQKDDALAVVAIIEWLDRPAIHDTRISEDSWERMQEAMRGLRLLLAQGVDGRGHIVTRPQWSFNQPYRQHLKEIYGASRSITRLLSPALTAGTDPSLADTNRIDRLRKTIQANATAICNAANIPAPVW